jgi:hypothetical protein
MRAACGRNRRCPTPTPALEWHIRPIKRGFQVFVVREDRLEGEQTRSLLAMHLAELYANSPPGGGSLSMTRRMASAHALQPHWFH